MNKHCMPACTIALATLLFSPGEAAAKSCSHRWAVPGTYMITANFRGTVETAQARLTRDCRVTIQIPGIYSGAKVTRVGKCLRFRFKVEGVRKTFSAKWCNTVGYIPWKGKRIRARVALVKRLGTAGG
jgi:hypothetical protein